MYRMGQLTLAQQGKILMSCSGDDDDNSQYDDEYDDGDDNSQDDDEYDDGDDNSQDDDEYDDADIDYDKSNYSYA